MADTKISNETPAGALAGNELIPGVQAGSNVKMTPSQIKDYVEAQLSGTTFLSATVSVSSAEILALFTTPKQLIAAPGAGKYIQVLHGYIFLDFGGSAYSNETTEIGYGTLRSIFTPITTFLNAGSDTLYNLPSLANSAAVFSQYENSAVQYRATAGNPTTGNGTISINLVYRIVTV